MFSEKEEILLHNYFDNLLSKEEQTEFEDCLLDNIDLAIELGKLKNLQRNLNNLCSNFNPPDTVIENIINSLLKNKVDSKNINPNKSDGKKVTKTKKTKRKLTQKTKYRLKQFVLILFILFFIVVLIFGYLFIVKNNKTTPWIVNNINFDTTQTSIKILEKKLEENSILETEENDNFLILIDNSGIIELSGKSKIKVLTGTKSLNSIFYYFGKLNFKPNLNNQLFELNYAKIKIQTINSNFLISNYTKNSLVEVLTNYIKIKYNDVEFQIPSNHSFYFIESNSISIPTNNNSSEAFVNLISSYSLTNNEILLSEIIKIATEKESFTLFYLLSQVPPIYREQIIKKLVKFVPLPSTVTKESILLLEQSSLNIWWDQIYISNHYRPSKNID